MALGSLDDREQDAWRVHEAGLRKSLVTGRETASSTLGEKKQQQPIISKYNVLTVKCDFQNKKTGSSPKLQDSKSNQNAIFYPRLSIAVLKA